MLTCATSSHSLPLPLSLSNPVNGKNVHKVETSTAAWGVTVWRIPSELAQHSGVPGTAVRIHWGCGGHCGSPHGESTGGGVLSSFLKHQCQQKRTQLQFSLLRALRKMEQKEPPRAGSWPFSNKTSDFNKQPPVSHQQSTMVFFWLRPPSFANLTTPSPAAWRGFCRD